ncbi:hypothetical protein EAS61_12645 [Bradyrhizobium zhanjiangense]|uniref:Uncharacterized protein n=1 Tax=Bradyrhizobium zhanjiangense TaxID=1325107 RepID=A0A4Q0QQN2_9BRAD|nr:hypothetical protein EAS61_12645 [Bradyrhizobium zhanjiangense]
MRAQRSNPESLRSDSLDCFVARAPRNDAGGYRSPVARMERSAIRGRLHVRSNPGLRFAPSGLRTYVGTSIPPRRESAPRCP